MNMTNKIILKNKIYLSLFNIVNILVPVVLIPIIIKKFDTKTYGEFVFFNTIFILISFVINLGTTQTGLVLVNSYKKKVNEVYSSILIVKFFLIVSSLIIILIICNFNNNSYYILLYSYFLFSDFLLSDWAYYYTNKLNVLSYINGVNKIIPLLILTLFYEKIESFEFFLTSCLLSSLFSGLISIIYLSRKGFKFRILSANIILQNLKIIIVFYFSFILGKIRLLVNKIILGGLLSYEIVAVYDIAEKIKNITILPSQILVDSTYSTHSKGFNRSLFKKTMMIIFITSLLLLLTSLIIVKSKYFINNFGDDNLFYLLLAFSPLVILQTVNYHFQKSYFLANSNSRLLNRVSIFSSSSFLILLSVIIISNNITIYYLIINNILSALIGFTIYLNFIQKNENIFYKSK